MKAQWNFFATSHVKSLCDGIRDTLKRGTTKVSLQIPLDMQILKPLQMFEVCILHFKDILILNVSKEKMQEVIL